MQKRPIFKIRTLYKQKFFVTSIWLSCGSGTILKRAECCSINSTLFDIALVKTITLQACGGTLVVAIETLVSVDFCGPSFLVDFSMFCLAAFCEQ